MTPDELERWWQAYLVVLGSALTVRENYADVNIMDAAGTFADLAVKKYRTAKATVVQTTYATRD